MLTSSSHYPSGNSAVGVSSPRYDTPTKANAHHNAQYNPQGSYVDVDAEDSMKERYYPAPSSSPPQASEPFSVFAEDPRGPSYDPTSQNRGAARQNSAGSSRSQGRHASGTTPAASPYHRSDRTDGGGDAGEFVASSPSPSSYQQQQQQQQQGLACTTSPFSAAGAAPPRSMPSPSPHYSNQYSAASPLYNSTDQASRRPSEPPLLAQASANANYSIQQQEKRNVVARGRWRWCGCCDSEGDSTAQPTRDGMRNGEAETEDDEGGAGCCGCSGTPRNRERVFCRAFSWRCIWLALLSSTTQTSPGFLLALIGVVTAVLLFLPWSANPVHIVFMGLSALTGCVCGLLYCLAERRWRRRRWGLDFSMKQFHYEPRNLVLPIAHQLQQRQARPNANEDTADAGCCEAGGRGLMDGGPWHTNVHSEGKNETTDDACCACCCGDGTSGYIDREHFRVVLATVQLLVLGLLVLVSPQVMPTWTLAAPNTGSTSGSNGGGAIVAAHPRAATAQYGAALYPVEVVWKACLLHAWIGMGFSLPLLWMMLVGLVHMAVLLGQCQHTGPGTLLTLVVWMSVPLVSFLFLICIKGPREPATAVAATFLRATPQRLYPPMHAGGAGSGGNAVVEVPPAATLHAAAVPSSRLYPSYTSDIHGAIGGGAGNTYSTFLLPSSPTSVQPRYVPPPPPLTASALVGPVPPPPPAFGLPPATANGSRAHGPGGTRSGVIHTPQLHAPQVVGGYANLVRASGESAVRRDRRSYDARNSYNNSTAGGFAHDGEDGDARGQAHYDSRQSEWQGGRARPQEYPRQQQQYDTTYASEYSPRSPPAALTNGSRAPARATPSSGPQQSAIPVRRERERAAWQDDAHDPTYEEPYVRESENAAPEIEGEAPVRQQQQQLEQRQPNTSKPAMFQQLRKKATEVINHVSQRRPRGGASAGVSDGNSVASHELHVAPHGDEAGPDTQRKAPEDEQRRDGNMKTEATQRKAARDPASRAERQAETAAAAAEEERTHGPTGATLEDVCAPYLVLDANLVIVDVSLVLCRLLGTQVEAVLYRRFPDVLAWLEVVEREAVAAMMAEVRHAAQLSILPSVHSEGGKPPRGGAASGNNRNNAKRRRKAVNETAVMEGASAAMNDAAAGTVVRRVVLRGHCPYYAEGNSAAMVSGFGSTEGGSSETQRHASNAAGSKAQSSTKPTTRHRPLFALCFDVWAELLASKAAVKPSKKMTGLSSKTSLDVMSPAPPVVIILRRPLLHGLCDALPLPLALVHPRSGEVLLWNRRAAAITGSSAYDMLGTSAFHAFVYEVPASAAATNVTGTTTFTNTSVSAAAGHAEHLCDAPPLSAEGEVPSNGPSYTNYGSTGAEGAGKASPAGSAAAAATGSPPPLSPPPVQPIPLSGFFYAPCTRAAAAVTAYEGGLTAADAPFALSGGGGVYPAVHGGRGGAFNSVSTVGRHEDALLSSSSPCLASTAAGRAEKRGALYNAGNSHRAGTSSRQDSRSSPTTTPPQQRLAGKSDGGTSSVGGSRYPLPPPPPPPPLSGSKTGVSDLYGPNGEDVKVDSFAAATGGDGAANTPPSPRQVPPVAAATVRGMLFRATLRPLKGILCSEEAGVVENQLGTAQLTHAASPVSGGSPRDFRGMKAVTTQSPISGAFAEEGGEAALAARHSSAQQPQQQQQRSQRTTPAATAAPAPRLVTSSSSSDSAEEGRERDDSSSGSEGEEGETFDDDLPEAMAATMALQSHPTITATLSQLLASKSFTHADFVFAASPGAAASPTEGAGAPRSAASTATISTAPVSAALLNAEVLPRCTLKEALQLLLHADAPLLLTMSEPPLYATAHESAEALRQECRRSHRRLADAYWDSRHGGAGEGEGEGEPLLGHVAEAFPSGVMSQAGNEGYLSNDAESYMGTPPSQRHPPVPALWGDGSASLQYVAAVKDAVEHYRQSLEEDSSGYTDLLGLLSLTANFAVGANKRPGASAEAREARITADTARQLRLLKTLSDQLLTATAAYNRLRHSNSMVGLRGAGVTNAVEMPSPSSPSSPHLAPAALTATAHGGRLNSNSNKKQLMNVSFTDTAGSRGRGRGGSRTLPSPLESAAVGGSGAYSPPPPPPPPQQQPSPQPQQPHRRKHSEQPSASTSIAKNGISTRIYRDPNAFDSSKNSAANSTAPFVNAEKHSSAAPPPPLAVNSLPDNSAGDNRRAPAADASADPSHRFECERQTPKQAAQSSSQRRGSDGSPTGKHAKKTPRDAVTAAQSFSASVSNFHATAEGATAPTSHSSPAVIGAAIVPGSFNATPHSSRRLSGGNGDQSHTGNQSWSHNPVVMAVDSPLMTAGAAASDYPVKSDVGAGGSPVLQRSTSLRGPAAASPASPPQHAANLNSSRRAGEPPVAPLNASTPSFTTPRAQQSPAALAANMDTLEAVAATPQTESDSPPPRYDSASRTRPATHAGEAAEENANHRQMRGPDEQAGTNALSRSATSNGYVGGGGGVRLLSPSLAADEVLEMAPTYDNDGRGLNPHPSAQRTQNSLPGDAGLATTHTAGQNTRRQRDGTASRQRSGALLEPESSMDALPTSIGPAAAATGVSAAAATSLSPSGSPGNAAGAGSSSSSPHPVHPNSGSAAARGSASSSTAAAMAALGRTTPLRAGEGAVWAVLVSRDEATIPSCRIRVGLGEEFRLGRSSKCTVVVSDSFVSSLQFAIVRTVSATSTAADANTPQSGRAGGDASASSSQQRPRRSKTFTVTLYDRSANGTYVNVKKIGKDMSCVLRDRALITFRLSTSQFFLGFVFMLTDERGVPLDDRDAAGLRELFDPRLSPRQPHTGRRIAGRDSGASSQNTLVASPTNHSISAARRGTPRQLSTPDNSSLASGTPNGSRRAGGNANAPRSGRNGSGSGSRRPHRETIEWKIGEEMLGKGGNAEVYLGINLTNGQLIAVKRVRLPQFAHGEDAESDPEAKAILQQYRSLQEEINVLSKATHPNIVQYYGSSQNAYYFNILLEFVPGGSLRHLLDNFGALSPGVILSYLHQALEGLAYLHRHNIVHSDIKTANILITEKGKVKLTDFGTARLLNRPHATAAAAAAARGGGGGGAGTDTQSATSRATSGQRYEDAASAGGGGGGGGGTLHVAGTLRWMDPALFHNGHCEDTSPAEGDSGGGAFGHNADAVGNLGGPTKASDIWSVGCAMIEMMSGEAPWYEYDFESEEQIVNLLTYTAEPPEIPECPECPDLVTIAKRCLQMAPSQRPACVELLQLVEEATARLQPLSVSPSASPSREVSQQPPSASHNANNNTNSGGGGGGVSAMVHNSFAQQQLQQPFASGGAGVGDGALLGTPVGTAVEASTLAPASGRYATTSTAV